MLRLATLGGLFIMALLLAFGALHPIRAASIGPDAAAPVIQFERLLAGQRLDGRLIQTSKPLLTLVYGVLYASIHDWRAVSLAAITAYALNVLLAAVLANRVAGLASAAFVAIAFLLSPILLSDIALAYAVTWALLCLLVAGLAVTAQRPRYWLAGLALMGGALARPEILAVAAFATGVTLLADVVARVRHVPGPPRQAYLVLIAFLAIPVLMFHDLALSGNPLYWATTAQIQSEGRHVRRLLALLRWFAVHFVELAPVILLAALGGTGLLLRRRWAIAVGLLGVIFGISLLFVVIGARGTYLSTRYLAPIDLGLVFAAGLGVSVVDLPAVRRWVAMRFRMNSLRRTALPLALGSLTALAIVPIWPLDRGVRVSVQDEVRLHANAQRAMAVIRTALGTTPTWKGLPASSGIARDPLVIVPPRLRAQVVVDLDLPLTEVAYSYSTWLNPAAGLPSAGTIVYHDKLGDKAGPRYSALEIDQPVIIGANRYVPILADPVDGVWVIKVEAAGRP